MDRINIRLKRRGLKKRQKSAVSIKNAEDLKAKDEQQPPVEIISKAHNKKSGSCRLNVSSRDLEDIDIDRDEDAIQKASMLALSSGVSIENEDEEGFGRLESGLSMIVEESRFVEVEDKALEDDPLFHSRLLISNPESWIDDEGDEESKRVHR